MQGAIEAHSRRDGIYTSRPDLTTSLLVSVTLVTLSRLGFAACRSMSILPISCNRLPKRPSRGSQSSARSSLEAARMDRK
jgi:hypothetical protein